MALDKNDLTRLLAKVPNITDKELPNIDDRIKWVETQLTEYKKAMYRQVLDVRTAKNFASKDDVSAGQVAENKINEVIATSKGIKWSLEALRAELAELKALKKASK